MCCLRERAEPWSHLSSAEVPSISTGPWSFPSPVPWKDKVALPQTHPFPSTITWDDIKIGHKTCLSHCFCAFLLCHCYACVLLFVWVVITLLKPDKPSATGGSPMAQCSSQTARPHLLIKLLLVNCISCFWFLMRWLTFLQILTTPNDYDCK